MKCTHQYFRHEIKNKDEAIDLIDDTVKKVKKDPKYIVYTKDGMHKFNSRKGLEEYFDSQPNITIKVRDIKNNDTMWIQNDPQSTIFAVHSPKCQCKACFEFGKHFETDKARDFFFRIFKPPGPGDFKLFGLNITVHEDGKMSSGNRPKVSAEGFVGFLMDKYEDSVGSLITDNKNRHLFMNYFDPKLTLFQHPQHFNKKQPEKETTMFESDTRGGFTVEITSDGEITLKTKKVIKKYEINEFAKMFSNLVDIEKGKGKDIIIRKRKT